MTNESQGFPVPGEECEDIARDTARAADRYYGAMTKWLVKRRRPREETKKVIWLARVYDRGLESLIDCFEGLSNRREHVARKRENAATLRSHLHKDLDYLESAQADET